MPNGHATEKTATFALAPWLREFTRTITPNQPYTPPTETEKAAFIAGLDQLLAGAEHSTCLTTLGFSIKKAHDSVSGREFLLVAQPHDARAWGVYILDCSVPISGLIAAPHPVFDENSEHMALQIWRDTPGLLLAISGTHRTDPGGHNIRDVAHQPGSLFHAVAVEAVRRKWPQFQQHGYRDTSDLMHDVIISSGDSHDTAGLHRLADSVEAAGFTVARNWDGTATVLVGLTNAQGEAAGENKTSFAHVEVSHGVRTNVESCRRYSAAVKQARYFDNK